MNEKFAAIPAAACRLSGGEVEIGDNGDGAKTAPVRLKARSGQPIEHWFWGRVVHDLAGMRRHKARLTIDYAHNDAEVLGYLNHFETETGDLVASGALTPFKEDDRASEVLFKLRQGVPYEASIFFGGDGIKVEEVPEGAAVKVNGYDFAGPGLVVREWPLRGVAICPYGADANTESAALASGETFKAIQVEKETTSMSEEIKVEQSVEAEAKSAEGQPVEAPAVEAEAKPEEKPVELTEQPAPAPAPVVEDIVARLSAELAEVKAQAEAKSVALQAALDEANKKLAALEKGAPPVSAVAAPKESKELTPWQKAQRGIKK